MAVCVKVRKLILSCLCANIYYALRVNQQAINNDSEGDQYISLVSRTII